MPDLGLFFTIAAIGITLQAQIVAPAVTQKVEPEYGTAQVTYLIDPTRVELTVDETGRVTALTGSASLPDNVVQAFAKWRFVPGTKNGKRAAFSLAVILPLKRSIEHYLEHAGAPYAANQHRSPDFAKSAAELTPEKAANIERKLKDNAESIELRVELLTYAASRGEADKDAQEMRIRQVSWLITNQPETPVLGSPVALVSRNSSDYAAVQSLWLNQVSKNPTNAAILYNATYFLRLSDPEKSEQLLAPATSTIGGAAAWLGRTYGLAAIGVNRIDPQHGDSGIDEKLAAPQSMEHARSMLASTKDERIMLGALAAVSGSGPGLVRTGHLPLGYAPFCQELLLRVKTFYPDAKQSCEVPKPSSREQTVTAANLVRKVPPEYPSDARSKRIQGSVRFAAVIAKDGSIKDLELLKGPLIFYDASRNAVLQWQYNPTKLNGNPVEVSTQVDVNFNFQ